jgi:hypothetical protein
MRNFFLLSCLLAAAVAHAQSGIARDGNKAPDYAREKRWADEITPALVVGDAIYLEQKSGHKFLALYADTKPTRAAVITVHGVSVHPDWGLIGALRSGLADHGYATLSVQMPVLAADATREDYFALIPDAADRLRVAVAFLKAKGHRNIAIACHSLAARMCNVFLVDTPDNAVGAWVSIGTIPPEFVEPGKLRLPVLDIYGARDFPEVLQKAPARAEVLRTLKGSAQVEVADADHYFSGNEGVLISRIRQFLDQKFKP